MIEIFEDYLKAYEKLSTETDRLELEMENASEYSEEYKQLLIKCIELEQQKLALTIQEANRIS